MQHYLINREQLDELKDKAVALRQEPPPNMSQLAGVSYEIEQLVAEVETNPTGEEAATEMTDDDEEMDNGDEK